MRIDRDLLLGTTAILMIVAGSPRAAAKPVKEPERIFASSSRSGSSTLLWASVGAIEEDGFSDQLVQLLEHMSGTDEVERDNCYRFPKPHLTLAGPDLRMSNPEDIRQNAALAVSGRVVEIDYGFWRGIAAASLLTIEVDKRFDTQKSRFTKPVRRLRFVYFSGSFEVNGLRFCVGEERIPEVEVGTRIVVFPFSGPLSGQGNIYFPYRDEFIVETKIGAKSGNPSFNMNKALGLSDFYPDFNELKRELTETLGELDP